MINFKEDEQLSVLNHSCAHVMAQAVKHLYPQAKFWVGPVVSEGFYYDIDLGEDVIKDEDIPKIEKEMKKICKDGKRIVREELSKEQALEMFKDDEYKIDLINNFEEGTNISCYRQGDFVDLCRGPHVETVKACKNFKLIKHSGAYWKGDKNNKVLQRIYGVCFETEEDLNAYLQELEEAKDLLIEQKPLVQAYVIDQVRDKMIGNEAAIGVIYSGEAIYTQRENPDLEYVIPKEGSNIWFDSWVIPKNAPNKENAEKFLNFLCRPDIALKNFEYITYSTPNEAARKLIKDDDIRNSKIAFPDISSLKNCETFQFLGDDADALYNRLWREVKSK